MPRTKWTPAHPHHRVLVGVARQSDRVRNYNSFGATLKLGWPWAVDRGLGVKGGEASCNQVNSVCGFVGAEFPNTLP
jgi:hypothetical protein